MKLLKAVSGGCLLCVSLLSVPLQAFDQTSRQSNPGDLLWVAAPYAGGRQCETKPRYSAPDTQELFKKAAIQVYQFEVEPNMVCAACGCPQYSATHFVLIKKNRAEAAQKLGFTTTDAATKRPIKFPVPENIK